MWMRHLALALVLGCSANAPPPPPAPAPPAPAPAPPSDHPVQGDGATCHSGAECASGICEGQGCDDEHLGTCASAQRACTRDARPYCGCDGKTFTASGTCPARRFSQRGACAD
jgi:hypothetical protein